MAVINPTKLADEAWFRQLTIDVAERHGWQPPVFMFTSARDPGHLMTRMALEMGADLVLSVGGDGTARVVSTGLAHTDVPSAIIPTGTGNLLARNLGIPLDVAGALEVAFTGTPRAIDLAQLVVDHKTTAYYTGMAGVGFDAAMMRDTNARLKQVVGSAAYVLAFARQLGAPPRKILVQVDDEPPFRRKALLMMVGNTSTLQGGIVLFPNAHPDDGCLELLLSAPTTLSTWARLAGAVLRSVTGSPAVEYWKGRRIVIDAEDQIPWEVDGDTEGDGHHFEFSVDQGALLVMTPRSK